jgi:hypothetical protein
MNILKNPRTLFCAAGLLFSALLTACGGGSDKGRDPILGIPAATVVSLAVTPASSSVPVGASRQFSATATYSDGSSRNVTSLAAWSSGTPAVASVASTGAALGLLAGSSAISASFDSKTGAGNLSVTAALPQPAATVTSIAVTPASATVTVGATQQYVATATFSDNSTAVITNAATWSSSNTAFATIGSTGLGRGVAVGSVTLNANFGAINGNAAMNVTAAPVIPVPPVIPPAAPTLDLGLASNFAVLAGTSITNNAGGTTLVSGDVGSPSQTVDPVQAAGYSNYKSGAILAGALADLQVAITDANSRTCTTTSASGIDLGGLTLTPGVYCYAGAISITGTFTMNGPGLYIFRTTSTLNSTANSIVALTNGATADNAFWLPVGPSTLGANSVFKGSILGQAAAITVGDNTTLLTGRVLSAAAVTLRNNQIAK